MFVGVRYHKDAPINGFAGATYTYTTTLELKCGDVVAAPVRNRGTGVTEDKKAMVVEINAPEPPFPCLVISAYWTEEKNDE